MTEEKKPAKKAQKKHIAKKVLFTSKGRVNKNEEFTCTAKELETFKASGAV